jgi:hypothetical protein
MKEPERRQFRQEVVFSAKYFHEHNFVNFIAETVGRSHSLIVSSEHKKSRQLSLPARI